MITAEQQARDVLSRIGIEGTQFISAGDLVELGNILADRDTSKSETSDGSTASYYELPPWAKELADLIRYKKMNGSQAEAFRTLYRGNEASHSDEKRQAKKLLMYAVDEVVRTHFPNESVAFYRNGVFEFIFGKTGEQA